MKKYHGFGVVLLVAVFLCTLEGVEGGDLSLIRTIGEKNNHDDYFFVMINGAVLSPAKDIYVVDSREHFLARFNWNGKLIKRIGQKGQGPGDFHGPRSLDLYEGKLYLLDSQNFRVAEIDSKLEKIKYFRLYDGGSFMGNFFIQDQNKCVGNYISPHYTGKYKGMAIVDFVTQQREWFFGEAPVEGILTRAERPPNALALFTLQPRFGIDRRNKELIISFSYPANPVEFFIYSFDGQCRDKFSYRFETDYRMPQFLIKGSRAPKEYQVLRVFGLHVYNNRYIAVVGKTTFTGPRTYRSEKYFLVFDRQSRVLTNKFRVPDFLKTFFISDDGYVLATQTDQNTPLLLVYKLNL